MTRVDAAPPDARTRLGQMPFARVLGRMSSSLSRGRLAGGIDRMLARRIDPATTLVVSGFWRSGTTWLQEVLARMLHAKTIFEPLDFVVPAVRELHAPHRRAGKSEAFVAMHLPYASTRLRGHQLGTLFDEALRGATRGWDVRRLRTGPGEAWRRQIVLKEVRAPLCLRALQDTFNMPVIHITRDPRAVVASLRRTNWRWRFEDLSLSGQLLDPADGRAAAFEQWAPQIREADGRGPLERLVAYWALTERFVRDTCHGGTAPMAWTSYEAIARGGEVAVRGLLEQLGLAAPAGRRGDLTRDSDTTSDGRYGVSLEDRVRGWGQVLSAAETAKIEAITRQFGLEECLDDRRPGSGASGRAVEG